MVPPTIHDVGRWRWSGNCWVSGRVVDGQKSAQPRGQPGVGKTGVLSPLFLELVHQGHTGLWVQYNDLMAAMRRFEDGQVEARMDACKQVEYLFIDDFGDPAAQRIATDYARDVMFRIVDHRISWNLALFVTSNLTISDLADQFHARIARRLVAGCAVVQMGGQVLK